MDKAPVYHLPPFTVESIVSTALAETVDWGLKLLGVPEQWKRAKGVGVKVAVLDTGVDRYHFEQGDLRDSVIDVMDFTGSQFRWLDRQGHGTHCAGVIGARQNNTGVVGIAPECQLLVGKVLGDDGSGASSGIAAGIDWARERAPHVISMSLGSSRPDERIHQAIQRATREGVYVICAAGNDGPGPGDTVGWPARFDEPVAVGAVDQNGAVAPFSSRGPAVDICAPGVDVLSTYLMGQYAKLSGTSMATPCVAGVVALMVSYALSASVPLPTPPQLVRLLKETATAWKPGQGGGSGAGIINPAKVIGLNKPAPQTGQQPAMNLLGLKIYSPSRAGDVFSVSL